jgi:hypothetical protein
MVYVSEGFDRKISAGLRDAVLAASASKRAEAQVQDDSVTNLAGQRPAPHDADLTLRFAASPELEPVRVAVQANMMRAVIQAAMDAAGR